MEYRFWTLDIRVKTLDIRVWTLDTRIWTLEQPVDQCTVVSHAGPYTVLLVMRASTAIAWSLPLLVVSLPLVFFEVTLKR